MLKGEVDAGRLTQQVPIALGRYDLSAGSLGEVEAVWLHGRDACKMLCDSSIYRVLGTVAIQKHILPTWSF